jgi:hypothetical protein
MGKFTKKQRDEILEGLNGIFETYENLINEYDNAEEAGKEKATEIEKLNEKSQELSKRYSDGLPIVPLSRCPFTGEILNGSFDKYGLDGFWWNSDSPLRADIKKPDTLFAFDGALKLSGKPEYADFNITPGPDKPFVRPRLLEDFVQVRVVISSAKVGKHTVYFMTYFTDPMLYGVDRINEFGTKAYTYIDEEGEEKIAHDYDNPDAFDFDIEYWLREGKVLWIKPGDETMELHGELAGCPYIGLEGSEKPKYIYKGQVTEFEETAEMAADDVDDELLARINEFVEMEGNLDA